MRSHADGSVVVQTTSESVPSIPSWFGEVVLISRYLRKHGVLTKISEGVRFARRCFGRYEVIDFLAVLFGYAISGERTLEEFYEGLPARSTLSRFLAALTEAPVEDLLTLFLDDLLSRPLSDDKQTGGLVDRAGGAWVIFDIDGTREAANAHCQKPTIYPRPFAGWMTCVRLATGGASVGRWCGRGRS